MKIRKDVQAVLAVMAIFTLIAVIASNGALILSAAVVVGSVVTKVAAIVGTFTGIAKVAPIVAALV